MLHVADPSPFARRRTATKLGAAMAPVARQSSLYNPPEQSSDLVPGLPDDVAFLCLVRVSRAAHPACRQVCKRWRAVLMGPELYEERVKQKVTEPWVYVRAVSRGSPRQWWQALDLRTATWQAVPMIPNCRGRLSGAGSAVLGGCLYVVGGMSYDLEQPIAKVYRYDPCSSLWRDMHPLLVARGYAAVEAVGDALYVAGGNGTRLCELRSVEMCKPFPASTEAHKTGQDTDYSTRQPQSFGWSFAAPMASDMARYDSTVCNGRLYVTEGWHWPFHFSPRGFVYDANKDRWDVMPLGMSEGWTGPACTVGDFVCVVAHQEATIHRLEVYDMESDEWHSLTGTPLPEEISPNFVVEAVGNDVYVIGDGLLTAIGHVTNVSSRGGNVTWSLLSRPDRLSDRYVDTACLLEI